MPPIFEKYNLRITQNRVEDFRSTMREIIEIKNGDREGDGRGTINSELSLAATPRNTTPTPRGISPIAQR